MDKHAFLTGGRWEILQQLAQKPQGTKELANVLKTSLPYVSQQLKQLELAGYVEKRRSISEHTRNKYHIVKTACYLTSLSPFFAQQHAIERNTYTQFLLLSLLHKHGQALTIFFLTHDIFREFTSTAVLRRKEPELLVISSNVEKIRKEYSNVKVSTPEGKRKIVIWSHTKQEIEEGLARKEQYFIDLIKQIDITYDPDHLLERLKGRAQ